MTVTAQLRVRDIPVALRHAANSAERGSLPLALDNYRRAEGRLLGLPVEEREDFPDYITLLREAQYGVATTLLRMLHHYVWDATMAARKALDDSFKDVAPGTDQRRYVLKLIAEATNASDFGKALTQLLGFQIPPQPEV